MFYVIAADSPALPAGRLVSLLAPVRPPLLSDELRLLTFRRPPAAIGGHRKLYLAFGLFFTWLAEVGRY